MEFGTIETQEKKVYRYGDYLVEFERDKKLPGYVDVWVTKEGYGFKTFAAGDQLDYDCDADLAVNARANIGVYIMQFEQDKNDLEETANSRIMCGNCAVKHG